MTVEEIAHRLLVVCYDRAAPIEERLEAALRYARLRLGDVEHDTQVGKLVLLAITGPWPWGPEPEWRQPTPPPGWSPERRAG